MANEHMQRCSTSLASRARQVRAERETAAPREDRQGCHTCWGGRGDTGALTCCRRESKMMRLLWNRAGQFLTWPNTELPMTQQLHT